MGVYVTYIYHAYSFYSIFHIMAVTSSSPAYHFLPWYIKLELNVIIIVPVTRKSGGIRHTGAWCNAAVITAAVYYMKNDLVASKRRVKKENFVGN